MSPLLMATRCGRFDRRSIAAIDGTMNGRKSQESDEITQTSCPGAQEKKQSRLLIVDRVKTKMIEAGSSCGQKNQRRLGE